MIRINQFFKVFVPSQSAQHNTSKLESHPLTNDYVLLDNCVCNM